MSTIVTRAAKGSPLTHAEVDANFTNLNNDKFQEGNAIGNTTPAAGTFTTLTGNSTSQFGRSSANYIQATGNTTTNSPEISALGSDTNIGLNLTTKGTGVVNLNTGAGTQVRIVDSGGTTVNRIHLQGQATGFLPVIASRGSDTNLGMSYSTQGTGPHDFYTAGTSFTQQFKITHTASAVNYVQVTGAATGAGPVISTQGSDTNISISLRSKGSGLISFANASGQFGAYVNPVSGSVNHIELRSAVASSGPVISTQGTDTNIDLNLTTKGTGAVRLNTGGGEQLRVSNTASAVNYVQVTGAATGSGPTISAQGSDSTVALTLNTKSTGILNLQVNSVTRARIGSDGSVDTGMASNGNPSFKALGVANQVNYVLAQGAAAGSSPEMSSRGSDTNIDLALTPKGTGLVRFGTHTATALTISGYIEIKDAGGTIRKLAVVT